MIETKKLPQQIEQEHLVPLHGVSTFPSARPFSACGRAKLSSFTHIFIVAFLPTDSYDVNHLVIYTPYLIICQVYLRNYLVIAIIGYFVRRL